MRIARSGVRIAARAAVVAGLILGLAHAGTAQTITRNGTGNQGGYFWSFWTTGQGSVAMTLGNGGNYSVSYSNDGDFTCGKGWNPGWAHTVGYNAGAYSNSGGGSFGVYGWTTSPLIEYYINEMWGSVRPTGTWVGNFYTDGGDYDIYKHQQVNQPSIQGTATFWQYFSTRTSQNSRGQNHTVNLGNHFYAWNTHGLNLGNFNVQYLLTEGWGGGSGYTNATVWGD